VLIGHDKSAQAVLSAFQNPKQASLISRHLHTLLLLEERYGEFPLEIIISQIRVMLVTCTSLRNLLLPVRDTDPEMRLNVLEHAPPTLRRIRFIGEEFEVLQLSTIPQATLQNLTHLELYLKYPPPCDKPFWQPLRSTSLQYLSFQWWEYLNGTDDHISLIAGTFAQRPSSLKALIVALYYDYHYHERCLDQLDEWFCTNQNDPKSSVVILAGVDSLTVGDSMWQSVTRSRDFKHNVWDNWAFLTQTLVWDNRCYDLCEELLPDGKLTIWEEADRALEERRLRFASKVQ
jgi:hypothetical protein